MLVLVFCQPQQSSFAPFQSWMDVKLTSPQLGRETAYKLSVKNFTLQSVSSRQDFVEFPIIALHVLAVVFGVSVLH